MIKKIFILNLLMISTFIACMEDPTPEDLGLDFKISTDKQFYRPGDEIILSFTNNSTSEVRLTEALIKEEGKSISYDKTFLFFIEIKQPNGTWKAEIPYESNYGSEFPYHMRPNEKKSWTSKKISETFKGNKIRFGTMYKDQQNNYSFLAYSEIIELSEY